MTTTAQCQTCSRTVYLSDEDAGVCPVCSTPLIAREDEPNESSSTGVITDQTS